MLLVDKMEYCTVKNKLYLRKVTKPIIYIAIGTSVFKLSVSCIQ